jgi:hypothetical protein
MYYASWILFDTLDRCRSTTADSNPNAMKRPCCKMAAVPTGAHTSSQASCFTVICGAQTGDAGTHPEHCHPAAIEPAIHPQQARPQDCHTAGYQLATCWLPAGSHMAALLPPPHCPTTCCLLGLLGLLRHLLCLLEVGHHVEEGREQSEHEVEVDDLGQHPAGSRGCMCHHMMLNQ